MGNSWNQVKPIIGRPTRVSQFLYKLYEEEIAVDRNRSKAELLDIGSAVTAMVENLVFSAFENDAIFHIPRRRIRNHVIGVGSYFEQTKIKDVDEFDFTFILPYITEDNVGAVKELYSPIHTCKHGISKDPFAYVELKYFGQHANMLMEKNLLTIINARRYMVACRTFAVVHEMMDACLSDRRNIRPIIRGTGTLESNANNFGDKLQCSGPAMKLYFKWWQNCGNNDLDIKVDLVPAIKASLPPRMHNYITAPFVMKKEISDIRSCLFVPKNKPNVSVDFMISFSQIETELLHIIRIKTPQWFYCYTILKFILWYDTKLTHFSTTHMFSSYILKTLLLQEALICEERCLSLAECLMKMLVSLQRYTNTADKGHKTHVEIRSTWFLDSSLACRSFKDQYEKQEILIVQDCLENITNVIINIDRCDNFEYAYHKREFLNVIKSLNTSLFHLNEKRKSKYS